MVNKYCRYTGIEMMTTPSYFLKGQDYIHPRVIIVKKEMVSIHHFTNTLRDMSDAIVRGKKDKLSLALCQEVHTVTRIAVAILVNESQNTEVIWRPEARIPLEGLTVTPDQLILEIKFLIFLINNYAEAKLKFAYLDTLTTCRHLYDRVRLLHTGSLVFTNSNAPPAVVLRSYDPTLKEGDCENFVKLAIISTNFKADYSSFGMLGHHAKFKIWVDLNLLKQIHLAILNKDHEVYDNTDRLLQKYNRHLELMTRFFYNFDVTTGLYLTKAKPTKVSKPTNIIPIKF